VDPATWIFDDDGTIPNSRLPVLIYDDVAEAHDADACEQLFARNGWFGAWRNGIYSFHHFHSTAHEVLGIVAGSATVMLGGPLGRELRVGRGQVLVLPAGTGHRNLGSDEQLLIVGAYPDGLGSAARRARRTRRGARQHRSGAATAHRSGERHQRTAHHPVGRSGGGLTSAPPSLGTVRAPANDPAETTP